MLLAFLLQATVAPGELRTFSDWTVGCDNGLACQAVALLPPDGGGALLTIRRGAEAGAAPVMWITMREAGPPVPRPTQLAVDGRRFRLTPDREAIVFTVADAAGAARHLGQATRIEALDASGRRVASVLTRGSAAALLYMDERQRRLGTTSALVRRGPSTRVPAPPPLPVVRTPALSARAPRTLAPAATRRLLGREAVVCDYAQELTVEGVRLDARTSLSLAGHPCGNGAYNIFSSAYLVDERGRARPATFDVPVGFGEPDSPPDNVLVGADWDPETRRLTSYARARGLGDCGSTQAFAWDGTRFRLVEQTVMGECRGSNDYITTWRARVIPARQAR